jgi:stalled ribosome alternative rescue factor ArfA
MDKYLKRLMKKVNPIAKMLTSTTFRQQTLASKKLYNRKKTKKDDEDWVNNILRGSG